MNPFVFSNPDVMNPTGPDWGLSRFSLEVARGDPARALAARAPITGSRELPAFARLLAVTGATSTWYSLVKPLDVHRWRRSPLWRQRLETAARTMRGEPLVKWPMLLRRRWNERHPLPR